MTIIPTLGTERLTLRALEERDLDAYAAMMADPEVARFLGTGAPMPRAVAWRQMAMVLGHWRLRGYGLWAVEERATGAFVGRLGCWRPEGWPALEIGYTLARAFWGRGFASEGARASLDYARTVLDADRVCSIIRPDNAASIRVAERLGAVRGEEIEFFGGRSLLFWYPPA